MLHHGGGAGAGVVLLVVKVVVIIHVVVLRCQNVPEHHSLHWLLVSIFPRRYRQKGYTSLPELFARIVQPSDNWEKTSGARALDTEKINAAFSDSSVYRVTPPAEKKNTELDSTQEKMTEL